MSNLLVEYSEPFPMKLMERLSVARTDFPSIVRDQDAMIKGRAYRYANLTQLIAATDPVLAKHELLIWEGLEVVDNFQGLCMMLVSLKEPEWIKTHGRMVPDDPGPRAVGTTISYLRRYMRLSILGLTQEDDDAQGRGNYKQQGNGSESAGPSPAGIADAIRTIDQQQEGYEGFLRLWKELPDEVKNSEQVKAKLPEWKKKFAPAADGSGK